MTMAPPRTRDELLSVIDPSVGTAAFVRALREGRNVEVFGGFVPAETLPFWAVRVWTDRGSSWTVAVVASRPLRTVLMDKIRWSEWVGCGDLRTAYCGDDPNRYLAYRRNGRIDSVQNGPAT